MPHCELTNVCIEFREEEKERKKEKDKWDSFDIANREWQMRNEASAKC